MEARVAGTGAGKNFSGARFGFDAERYSAWGVSLGRIRKSYNQIISRIRI
jgi:hypothetical protein